jgi:hypothetical protein
MNFGLRWSSMRVSVWAVIVAGAAAGSASLQADTLYFVVDAANYAISLGVAGMTLTWRSKAAVAKGGTMTLFAPLVLGNTLWHAMRGTLPRAEVESGIGNAHERHVALMLYRFRSGNENIVYI